MLDAAPDGLQQKIVCQLDEEFRVHLIMLHHASGDEFRAYIKADYRRFYEGGFYPDIVAFHLKKLQFKIEFIKFCRKFVIAGQPTS